MKISAQIGLFLIAGIILLLPLYLTNQQLFIKTPTDLLFFIHRLLGLYAFSLIFIQIIIGSCRLSLNRVFSAGKVIKTHMTIGKIAFLLAIMHPIFLYSTYLSEHNLNFISAFQQGTNLIFYSLGITALILLFISIGAALFRLRLGPKWIYLHRINYLIFWIVIIHSFYLGIDVKSQFAHSLYAIYGATIAIVTLFKIFISIKKPSTK